MKREPTRGDYAGLGAGLAGAFLVPLLAGIAVDAAAHTGPVFLFIGLGLGIVLAAVTAFVRFKQFL
jgi:F0F1-type ATP synthase assembly protein I